jgi:hypothetical protein
LSKNLPLFKRFFSTTTDISLPYFETYFKKQYIAQSIKLKTVKIVFRPIICSIFPFVCFVSCQSFVETRTVSSDYQVIGTPSSYRLISRIFSILTSCRLLPTKTTMDGWFRLRNMSSYKRPVIFIFIIITVSCGFGTGDADLCMQAKKSL